MILNSLKNTEAFRDNYIYLTQYWHILLQKHKPFLQGYNDY